MGYLTELKLASTVTSNGNINVYDVTTYPLTTLETRDDVGVIIAWSSNDDPTTLDGYSLTNFYPTENWEIETLNNVNYQIWMLVVPKWESGTYSEFDVVLHNEKFYFCGGTTTVQPGVVGDTDWYDMSLDDNLSPVDSKLQLLFTEAEYKNISIGYSFVTEVIKTNDLVINQLECYNYLFIDNTNTNTNKLINILSFDEEVNLNYTIDNTQSNEVAVDLSDYGDNVYIVTMTDAVSEEVIMQNVIYSFCGIRNCYLNMFSNMMCNDIDFCATTNECGTERSEFQRYMISLLKLSGFYFDILSRINMERVMHINMFTFDDMAMEQITEIGQLIANAKLVTQSCGACSDTSSAS